VKQIIAGLLAVGFLAGCATSPTLVQKLANRSVTYENTERIVLTGSEGGYGSAVKVNITEEFLIQDIWDRIHQSRPYNVWYASGYKELAFYTRGQENKPSLTLLVNESEACHIEGATERFRCPGINAVLHKLLEHEYQKMTKEK